MHDDAGSHARDEKGTDLPLPPAKERFNFFQLAAVPDDGKGLLRWKAVVCCSLISLRTCSRMELEGSFFC